MTSKGAKDTIVAKLGFKSGSSSSKTEAEMERVRRENAHLRRKMDELAKRHSRPPDSDKSKLLERIVSLETLRERNNQQLLVKEQELETVRQQLSAKGGEVVAALQSQLDQRRKDADKRDLDFQNLSQETENLKNKLATVSARCQSLETQAVNGHSSTADLALVQDQLRDALEKNQQWLVYDQQREAFVQSVLARTHELEQQLSQARRQDSTSTAAAAQDAASESSEKEAQLRSRYEQSVLASQKQLDEQKDQLARARQELVKQKEECVKSQAELQRQTERVARLQEETAALQRRFDDNYDELSSLQSKYKERTKELEEARVQMQTERLSSRNAVSEERQVSSDRADRMRIELESMDLRLEEERKRSAELLLQVTLLQKSLLSQNEEQRRIAALEQQIQLSVKDFENEKMDRQSVQHQLHKVLKELRKARDQIAKLESSKQPTSRFSEPSSYKELDVERLTLNDARSPTSPSKAGSLLDESFLECPRCRAHYPTSRHRELLAHIDFCLA
ncbi:centrosomal protein of 55 kDa [Phyllopteryx taeniolatus]|uniref:centrosomal protein of 55 kDa n=1 Tax=Phyllopteryx taeniolatus TaxID=161469 RepID=UPI002AD4CB46|nr:centrosomal protein of 55 kDa [Phyllopteryx taeniolatus]XP_061612228.1 centrosomal protein of 55 kDa [Phyllopteryx taeniolatus]XP_061612229.1 centrosomal protein of 55 kDa [Phyllopteryx taeniolatus]